MVSFVSTSCVSQLRYCRSSSAHDAITVPDRASKCREPLEDDRDRSYQPSVSQRLNLLMFVIVRAWGLNRAGGQTAFYVPSELQGRKDGSRRPMSQARPVIALNRSYAASSSDNDTNAC